MEVGSICVGGWLPKNSWSAKLWKWSESMQFMAKLAIGNNRPSMQSEAYEGSQADVGASSRPSHISIVQYELAWQR